MDQAAAVGAVAATGALIKVQPGLLAVWAMATGRYRAAVAALASAVALAAAATLATGVGAWATYADLVRGLSETFSTPHNFARGRSPPGPAPRTR